MKKLLLGTFALSCMVLTANHTTAYASGEEDAGIEVNEFEADALPQTVWEELRSVEKEDFADEGLQGLTQGNRSYQSGNSRHGGRGNNWDRPRYNHPRYNPPRHRQPRYNPPRWRQAKVCFARNARGTVFRASGYSTSSSVQRAAVSRCRANSHNARTCRPAGCR